MSSGPARLARHVRLRFAGRATSTSCAARRRSPCSTGASADILELCDGRRTVAEIVAELGARYDRVPDDEVRAFLARSSTGAA